jgi:hypothetical protein
VPLAGGGEYGQWRPVTIAHEVQFGAESAAGTA